MATYRAALSIYTCGYETASPFLTLVGKLLDEAAPKGQITQHVKSLQIVARRPRPRALGSGRGHGRRPGPNHALDPAQLHSPPDHCLANPPIYGRRRHLRGFSWPRRPSDQATENARVQKRSTFN